MGERKREREGGEEERVGEREGESDKKETSKTEGHKERKTGTKPTKEKKERKKERIPYVYSDLVSRVHQPDSPSSTVVVTEIYNSEQHLSPAPPPPPPIPHSPFSFIYILLPAASSRRDPPCMPGQTCRQ